MRTKNYKCFTAREYIGEKRELSVSKKIVREGFDLHWHDFFEIEIILDGNGTQELNGHTYTLERGLIYLLSPTDFHTVKCDGNILLYNIMFHESMLSEEFLYMIKRHNGNNIFKLNEEELSKIIAMCEIFEEEYSGDEKYKNEFLKNMLECFLIIILRKLNSQNPEVKNLRSRYIQRAILYLQLHFKENPSLNDIAKEVGLNPNYFSQKFRAETGKTYKNYLTELKISYAKKLLLSTNLNVTEICFAAGFTSIPNFMKVFREKTGSSPAKYRQTKEKETAT